MAKKAAKGSGTIRKKTITRNGKQYEYWEARVTVGRDPGTGRQLQRSFTGQTQKEVREKLTQAAAELDRGTYQDPSKITVRQWLNEWLNTFCVNRLNPLTITTYEGIIRNHLVPAMGAMELQAVKGIHIQQLYNTLLEKGLCAGTVNNIAVILHGAFRTAQRQRLIVLNPCDAADPPKAERHEIKPLTDDEIPRFLEAIEDSPMRNAYALCLFIGLREGECLGLSWSQVDFQRGRVTINQQLQRNRSRGSGQGYYIAHNTKGGKPRTIELPPIALDCLRAERVRQLENRLKAGSVWDNPFDLVFTDETGKHYETRTFYQRFKKIAASIGRPDARPHDLRHTAATVAIASGADIKSVQSMLGHATASVTLNVYAHTSEQMLKDTAARMQGYYDSIAARG